MTGAAPARLDRVAAGAGRPERRVPERTCVGCRAARPKSELARLVLPRAEEGAAIALDPTGRRNGRGAYLCADHPLDCLATALKRRALPRALRTAPERVDVESLEAALASITPTTPSGRTDPSPR
ncbi:MAG TPA: YlxR family protein [Candidatus Dormibacteraeota bacterium]|nr:YlxR family protein [Candidatus Dormibacteraeota bacterium]